MKSLLYKLGYPIFKCYWFIFRPKTQGVKCLVLCKDEVVLIRHTYGNSVWTLPGGGFKKGETKEVAVKREVKEELGLNINPEYLGEFTHNTEYKMDTVYCFVAKIEKTEPVIDPGEILQARWWNLKELPKDHSTGLDRILKMYHAHIFSKP